MFTFKDEKDYFKRECKSKKYLMKKLSELNEELDNLCIALVKEPRHRKKELWSQELTLLEEKKSISNRINYIDDVIANVRDPQVRGIITDLWVYGHSKTKVSQTYNFSSEYIYEKISNELEKVLKRPH